MAILSRIGSLTASAANISAPLVYRYDSSAPWPIMSRRQWYDFSLSLFVRAPFYAQAVALALMVIGLQYVAQTGRRRSYITGSEMQNAIKTGLAILTFIGLILLPQVAPALKNYQSLDPHNIPTVLDLPIPKLKATAELEKVGLSKTHVETRIPNHLLDPSHALDHFYEALLKGGTVRILHYGDSPTTGDLITADARAALQKEFGDGGAGFILIARPWAWYNHRGVEMDGDSGWKIEIAAIAKVKDGMHGLGGVSFFGWPARRQIGKSVPPSSNRLKSLT